MIVFDLTCAAGHCFEGWFGSADDFAAQSARGLLSCPSCGAADIERVPSATRFNSGAVENAPAAKPEQALQGKDPMAIAQILYARLVDQMLTTSEDVGKAFPEEARRIHYEEVPARAIRGEATPEQHAELVDEGIPVLRIPMPARDQFS
ncbi:MAG: DUF1178 family protein [Betaproteobacteria bacterium]|nr:MAG: DUF1178 family protein [Betaproteobacteria bacterium]